MPSIGPVEILLIGAVCLIIVVPVALLVGLAVWLIRRSQPNASPVATPSLAQDPSARLKSLQKMLDDGLISREEFDAKRAEIVKSV